MQVTNEKFIVLDAEGVSGLLVSDYVYKPGRIFHRNEWKWGDIALDAAIKRGRCKLVNDSKVETVKSDSEISDKSKKQKKLESLYEKYSEFDSESDEAKKIEDKIKKIETEIAEEDGEK